jgi:microcystin-dependent protein
MSSPFVGEIRMFAGNFAPVGWALCNGAILPISENDTLFNLIGTTYGGDGQSTFSLPDLQSRVPIHQGSALGNTFIIGHQAGTETVILTTNQIPAHTHAALAGGSGTSNSPAGKVWANWTGAQYSDNLAGALGALPPAALSLDGGNQPHDNRMPFLAINFIISLFGVFPTQ